MQTFIDTATQKIWQYEDDVIVTDTAGVYSFKTAAGVALNSPATLQPYTIPAPTPTQLAATAQAIQVSTLQVAYNAAVQANVSYTSKGNVTETYQANPQSVQNLQNTILGFQAAGVVPTGFYWVAADNTQVPFTYADLQGLAAVMVASGWANFQTLQTKKAQIVTLVNLPPRAASTPYTTGVQIVDTNGNVWTASAGTTGTTCTFPTSPAIGATKTDGSVTWTFAGSQVALIEGVTW